MNRILLILLFTFIQVNALLAGPGGRIAKELFDSPLGKIVGILLAVVFLPLILLASHKRRKSVKGAKKMLDTLARISPDLFDEINLKNRVTDVFSRVHKAWSEQDLEDCADFMTSWYRQNQQMVFLNEWKSKGLMNVCTVKKINKIEPIHIRLTEKTGFEGSRIMFAIDANMEDYLVKVDDSSVIEGKRGFRDVETVWTLQLNGGVWKVDNIEQSEMIPTYLKMDTKLSDGIVREFSKS